MDLGVTMTSTKLKGQDYPIGYVRWTEKRNFEAILDLFEAGSLDVGPSNQSPDSF